MARAARPGVRRRAEAERKALRITLKGQTLTLYVSDLGPADDRICRRETGFPTQEHFNAERFGADSILVVWWMARRKNGEPMLRYAEVEQEFPSYADLADAELEEVTDEEEVPEGSGPGSGSAGPLSLASTDSTPGTPGANTA